LQAEPADDSVSVAGNPPTTVTAGDQVTDRTIGNPYREPQFHDALVRYLVDSGLSATDSERVVATAIDALTECLLTSDFDPTAMGLSPCNSNALRQTGLDEGLHSTALSHAWGSLARRLALEAAARAEAGQ
jgi:hypothetical protein